MVVKSVAQWAGLRAVMKDSCWVAPSAAWKAESWAGLTVLERVGSKVDKRAAQLVENLAEKTAGSKAARSVCRWAALMAASTVA